MIKNLKKFNENTEKNILTLSKKIILKNINYSYPNSSRTALNDINLIIPANSKVGFVGTTGSGKTTTVDIIKGFA